MNRRHVELQKRLQVFACCCIKISEIVPKTLAGQHLANQLVRSSTSPALNYGEAVAAESRKDFIHKMKVCLKELHESDNSLRLILMMQWVKGDDILPALKEVDELISIFTSSVKTALLNREKQNPP
jgi:four helix bundle protein